MTRIAINSIDDVGLPFPKGMPDELAEPFLDQVAMKAVALRMDAMSKTEPEIAARGNPWARLKFVTEILQQSLMPQADHTVAEFSAAGDVQCRSGCSFCCYQNVDTTIPEAILVALTLAGQNDPERAEAVIEAAEAFKDLDDEERVATGKPCPMLVDRRCSVYAVRPITCRSLTSPDAARCHTAMANLEAGKGPLSIEIYVVLRFLCSAEQGAMRGISRDLGLQHDIVELTQTVAAILRDPALVERWANGERVFAAR